jgi:hypothetical protein
MLAGGAAEVGNVQERCVVELRPHGVGAGRHVAAGGHHLEEVGLFVQHPLRRPARLGPRGRGQAEPAAMAAGRRDGHAAGEDVRARRRATANAVASFLDDPAPAATVAHGRQARAQGRGGVSQRASQQLLVGFAFHLFDDGGIGLQGGEDQMDVRVNQPGQHGAVWEGNDRRGGFGRGRSAGDVLDTAFADSHDGVRESRRARAVEEAVGGDETGLHGAAPSNPYGVFRVLSPRQ